MPREPRKLCRILCSVKTSMLGELYSTLENCMNQLSSRFEGNQGAHTSELPAISSLLFLWHGEWCSVPQAAFKREGRISVRPQGQQNVPSAGAALKIIRHPCFV